jgi:hypothetical protein
MWRKFMVSTIYEKVLSQCGHNGEKTACPGQESNHTQVLKAVYFMTAIQAIDVKVSATKPAYENNTVNKKNVTVRIKSLCLIKHHTMKTHVWGSGDAAPPFITLALDKGSQLHAPATLPLGKQPPVPIL